tara:strand:- start:1313 stop:1609 length:297 start_codon:yes stop_codon:yes gene_type:complete
MIIGSGYNSLEISIPVLGGVEVVLMVKDGDGCSGVVGVVVVVEGIGSMGVSYFCDESGGFVLDPPPPMSVVCCYSTRIRSAWFSPCFLCCWLIGWEIR